MCFEGELRSWNWDKHCFKFHGQICMIDEWAANGTATCKSNEDQISAFLKTIPKNFMNSKLLIAKGIIDGDRTWFPTLVGNVIPHLTMSIEAKEQGAPQLPSTQLPTQALHQDSIPGSIIERGVLLA